jgi:outer membrane protein TolC
MKIIAILIIVPLVAIAKVVSFQDALKLAETSNKELKAKKYDIDLAKEILKEPYAHKKGKLEFVESVSKTDHAGHIFGMKMSSREATFSDFGFSDFLSHKPSPMDSSVLPVEPRDLNYPDSRKNFETKVVYEIPLFTGYKLENAQTMAKLQLLAKKAKLSHETNALGLEVIKAYNGAVAAKKFIAMTKNARDIAKRFQSIAQDMYDSGLTRVIDISQSKMAVNSINTRTKEAKTQFNIAIAYLQFLTSDSSITDVKEFKSFKPTSNKLSKLQSKALNNRYDLESMEHNVETMKTKIEYDSSGYYPTLGAYAEYGTQDNRLSLSSDKDYYLVAAKFKQTIFDGGLLKISKQKAKIEYEKIKEYQSFMRDGVKLEVKRNFLEYQTGSKTLKEKLKTQKMARDILEETENIYKNNLKYRTNMTYLLMGLETMLKAEADVITSTYNSSITSAKLILSTGRSLKD